MLLLKQVLPNKVSISMPIGRFVSGGFGKRGHHYQKDMWFRFCLRCKAIRKHLVYGNGILTRSFGIGLVPTIHEPCLYSGVIEGQRVLLLRQVDDFATAAEDASTCEKVLDLIDAHLKIPLKRLGLVTMYNGVNVEQTKHYIKLSCETYIDKISARHLDS